MVPPGKNIVYQAACEHFISTSLNLPDCVAITRSSWQTNQPPRSRSECHSDLQSLDYSKPQIFFLPKSALIRQRRRIPDCDQLPLSVQRWCGRRSILMQPWSFEPPRDTTLAAAQAGSKVLISHCTIILNHELNVCFCPGSPNFGMNTENTCS